MSDEYVIEVKPSARRASRAAGEWVHEHGRRRTFESKALAREWAHTDADGRVWVQNAAPHDSSSVDGYLVGGRRPVRSRSSARQSTIDAQQALTD
ncbi:hypothetical protein [Halococcus hamelinensis]|uniref:hypothetical protein n=1 Tax=Halococcus hamelinensis TaxID=332168 RepID=UPI001ED932AB|nr:hypothetical protein [Halococcus hamelinensis]